MASITESGSSISTSGRAGIDPGDNEFENSWTGSGLALRAGGAVTMGGTTRVPEPAGGKALRVSLPWYGVNANGLGPLLTGLGIVFVGEE